MSSNTTRYRLFNAASITPSRSSALSSAEEEQSAADERAPAQSTEGAQPGEAAAGNAVVEEQL